MDSLYIIIGIILGCASIIFGISFLIEPERVSRWQRRLYKRLNWNLNLEDVVWYYENRHMRIVGIICVFSGLATLASFLISGK